MTREIELKTDEEIVKRAEAAFADAKYALEREKDILQAVMNGAKNSHLAYLDLDFNFVRVNETYAQTCGYLPEQMIGKNHFALYPHAENEAIFTRVRDFGESVAYHDKPFEFPDQPERGVTYWDWTLTPVKDQDGRVTGLVFSLFETTERKRAEEELRKTRDELELRVRERTEELTRTVQRLQEQISQRERAENSLHKETLDRLRTVEALREKEQILIQQSRQAAMGEMIGNIAHQWRQPLNTIGLTIQALPLVYESDEFPREFLEKSVNSAMELIQHMSRTIDDFRNYFRPEKDKVKFNVQEAITNTLLLMEGSLHNPKINIEFESLDDPFIYGYQNEFTQVIINILINARDVLLEREIADPKVKITIFIEGGRAVITVADNGGGVPEEIIHKIFDPYFTTKGPQRGTGVGLFMSKNIIEKSMGGSLSVRNIADGAEFRIEV